MYYCWGRLKGVLFAVSILTRPCAKGKKRLGVLVLCRHKVQRNTVWIVIIVAGCWSRGNLKFGLQLTKNL